MPFFVCFLPNGDSLSKKLCFFTQKTMFFCRKKGSFFTIETAFGRNEKPKGRIPSYFGSLFLSLAALQAVIASISVAMTTGNALWQICGLWTLIRLILFVLSVFHLLSFVCVVCLKSSNVKNFVAFVSSKISSPFSNVCIYSKYLFSFSVKKSISLNT